MKKQASRQMTITESETGTEEEARRKREGCWSSRTTPTAPLVFLEDKWLMFINSVSSLPLPESSVMAPIRLTAVN